MVEIGDPERMFCVGADGRKIVRCAISEITAAKACELIRDMLAGRLYQVPDYAASKVRTPN